MNDQERAENWRAIASRQNAQLMHRTLQQIRNTLADNTLTDSGKLLIIDRLSRAAGYSVVVEDE